MEELVPLEAWLSSSEKQGLGQSAAVAGRYLLCMALVARLWLDLWWWAWGATLC